MGGRIDLVPDSFLGEYEYHQKPPQAPNLSTAERTNVSTIWSRTLCMANGMKTPKINIIDDDSLNAFASGINDRTYTVTLSKGIIQEVERRRTGSSHRPRTDSHPQQRCAPADRLDCICRNLLDADADHFLYYYARAHT